MKNILFFLMLLISFLTHSQSVVETVDYINDKLTIYEGTGFGEFISIKNQDVLIRYYTVPLYKIINLQDVEINFVYDETHKGITDYRIMFNCKNKSNCIKVMGKVEGTMRNTDNANSTIMYINDIDAAIRMTTAFKHLKELLKSSNELFGY